MKKEVETSTHQKYIPLSLSYIHDITHAYDSGSENPALRPSLSYHPIYLVLYSKPNVTLMQPKNTKGCVKRLDNLPVLLVRTCHSSQAVMSLRNEVMGAVLRILV